MKSRQVAPLSDIALHLGVTPDVARPMVETWMRKGRVERVVTGQACSGCDRCGAGALEIYRWRNDGSRAPCDAGSDIRRH
jgi:hypothetical protein